MWMNSSGPEQISSFFLDITLPKRTIQSVFFNRYVFLRPRGNSSLLISSPKRENHIQHAAQKFLVNPAVVNAVFVHFPNSWDGPADQIHIPESDAVLNHYRTIDENTTTFDDTSLVAEAPALQQALQARFKMPWESLYEKLARPEDLPPLPTYQSQYWTTGYPMD
mmetsp:Transcript_106904/g.205582  ORF Transcript_106904/g.205582 Transcript_106904/m.205582 type:complete len:165 (-) Transcript_106904:88-582(-)